jgi:hypothetical protein
MKIAKWGLNISREWLLILFFVLIKLSIHLFTYANYELHRDAYLYYAQSEHLAWGFFAVPPSIAVVGKIATTLFGNTTFALRFFPAVIGALNLLVIGLMARELKGKAATIVLASLAFLLSPAYLHTNALFQPVSFNQFYWLLGGYLILLMIKRNDPKIWIWIAIVFALAFLNKYSLVFFAFAFAISLLMSPYRYLYLSKYFFIALAIGFAIILPNLVWQYQNNWPVLQHMEGLQRTQLVHVRLSDFSIAQFLMNLQGLFLWVTGLIAILFFKKEKQYRIFGFIFLIVIALLILGRGKSYYSLGLYPIFFVFGAHIIEKYVKKYLVHVSVFLVLFMFIYLYESLSYGGIPFNSFEDAVRKDAFRWEDGINHDIPQDLADMTGWTQVARKVIETYLSLDPQEQQNCDIFCYHYGQAGAVMFYGNEENLTQPLSFNDSFIFWSPDSLSKEFMIWVHSDLGNDINPDSLLPTLFETAELTAVINDPFFREDGTKIYLCRYPNADFKTYYKSRIGGLKEAGIRHKNKE